MYTINVTVQIENALWVGVFERDDHEGYAVARKIFGSEPSDAELYDFVSHHYQELKFSEPQIGIKLIIKRKNPKRVLREVKQHKKRASNSKVPMTRAQEALKEELEKNKKQRRQITRAERIAKEAAKFQLRQEKKKQKYRGH